MIDQTQERDMTLAEAAAAVEVPESTLKRWLQSMPGLATRKDGRGAWRFNAGAVEAIKRVKALRDSDRAIDSIRVILGPLAGDIPEVSAQQSTTERSMSETQSMAEAESAERTAGERVASDERAASDLDLAYLVATLRQELTEATAAAVAEQTDLAEKYARAAHQIGKLEAQLEAAQADGRRLAIQTTQLEEEARAGREAIVRMAELQAMVDVAQANSSERRRIIERAEAERERAEAERARLELELARAQQHAEQLHSQLSERAASYERAGAKPKLWWRFWG
jgi:chromosome segregation ATPase